MGLPMSRQPSITATIGAHRKKRQKWTPFIIGGMAILLVVIGVIILVVGFSGGGGFNLFSTQTPTPTITPSPTNTPIPTSTPTITPTPTDTPTPTPSVPYNYTVVEGDSLIKIAKDHGLDDNGYLVILLLNPQINPNTQIIFVGQTILLPPPGMQLPTATTVPSNAPPGTKINYFVMPGDSLGSIANKLNSTIDDIVKNNKDLLKDGDKTVIYPGWTLVVRINLVTPQPTSTPAVTQTPTATKTP
ncbi:MAG: hypothetical protein C0393_06155 [Anaerolinea sp.]|nr:hypothetical protein [Anaerolinea sp.]